MSDLKSKLPDFKELSSMATKLIKGLKTSVEEIVHDYKAKRKGSTTRPKAQEAKEKPAKTTRVKAHQGEEPKKRTVKKTKKTENK